MAVLIDHEIVTGLFTIPISYPLFFIYKHVCQALILNQSLSQSSCLFKWWFKRLILPFGPGRPGISSIPGRPLSPALPVAPGRPDSPLSPGTPFMPTGPGIPGSPGVPLVPGKPMENHIEKKNTLNKARLL